MKRFPLLPQLALVFAVIYACSDSTAPANSNALAPKDAVLGFLGDPPPPPVDAAINITIESVIHLRGAFNGRYFSNGRTAWLQLDNRQPDGFETSASANARFLLTDNKMSGKGTLMIEGHVVTIGDIISFSANPNCGITGEPCTTIIFDATVDNESGHTGTAEGFNSGSCTPPNEGGLFSCGEGE
jgi:hypothetical protein